jgi:hypothetical protein
MTAHRHHYLPLFYLKGFARYKEKPKVYVADLRNRKEFSTNPINIGVRRDFNTIQVDGYAPDEIESRFSSIESKISPHIEAIIEKKSISDPDDRAKLFSLIGLIAIRNPQRREMVRSFHQEVTKTILELATLTPERWANQIEKMEKGNLNGVDLIRNHEEVRKLIESKNFRVNVANERIIHLEGVAIDAIIPFLIRRKWTLIKAKAGSTGFLTSDHPVCLMWSKESTPHRYSSPGFGLPNTQVIFPISSDLAVLGAFEGEEFVGEASDQLVAKINTAIILNSEGQIYGKNNEFNYFSGVQHGIIKSGSNIIRDLSVTENFAADRKKDKKKYRATR